MWTTGCQPTATPDGLNVANMVLIARADGIPARSKVLGALTSAGFAAGFGYLAARRR